MRKMARPLTGLFVLALSLGAIAQDREEIELHFQRADARAARGAYGEAISQLEIVLEVAQDEENEQLLLDIFHRLMSLNATKGYYEEAEEYLEWGQELEAAAEHRDFQHAMGRYLSYRGRYGEAEDCYRRMLSLDEGDWGARIALAETLDTQGKKIEAQKHLSWLLDQVYEKPDLTAQEYHAAGRACFLLDTYADVKNRWARGMIEYAWELYSAAQELDPEYIENLIDKGELYMAQNNHSEAQKVYEKALAVNDNHVRALVGLASATLGMWQLGYDRYRLASEYLDRAAAINESHPELLQLRAVRAFDDDQYGKALAALARALEVNPYDRQSLSIKACCDLVTGDFESFEQTERMALDANPLAARFYWQIATIVDRKFLYKEAAEFSRKALALDPDFWPAMTTLGLNLMRVGDEVEAKRWLEAAHQHDPRNIYTENMLNVSGRIEREYETIETEHFIVRLHKDQRPILEPYVLEFLDDAYTQLTEKYGFEPQGKVLHELFAQHDDFSARSVGVPYIGAIGVCFGMVFTQVGPSPQHSWARTLWHEFAHVITVSMTKHRVPRWLTEGISTYEESQARPEWRREFDQEILEALHHERLLGIRELNQGFTKPKWPGQILLSYYQGAMICQFIEETWGFEKIVNMLHGYRDFKTPDEIFSEQFGLTLEEFDAQFLDWVREFYQDYTWKPGYDSSDVRRFKRAVRRDPNNPELLAELARAYLFIDKIADAETYAGKALDNDPLNGDAFLVIAGLAMRRERKDLAKQFYLQAVDNGTTHPFAAFYNLGNLLLEEEKLRQAAAMFREAEKCFPSHEGVLRQLLAIHTQLGLDDERLEMMEKIATINHLDVELRLELAELYSTKYLEDRGWAQAAALLEQILAVNPMDPNIHGKLGVAWKESGDHGDKTKRELDMATRFNADGVAQYFVHLAELCLIRGELDEAQAAAENANKHNTLDEARVQVVLDEIEKRRQQER